MIGVLLLRIEMRMLILSFILCCSHHSCTSYIDQRLELVSYPLSCFHLSIELAYKSGSTASPVEQYTANAILQSAPKRKYTWTSLLFVDTFHIPGRGAENHLVRICRTFRCPYEGLGDPTLNHSTLFNSPSVPTCVSCLEP